MKAAIYMRVSTDKQEDSIDSQRIVLESYANTHRIQIVNKYQDEGISGRTAEKRPAFMQMIEDSAKEIFDTVLIYDSSRFARNLEESILYKSELKRNGVKLISVTEPTIDDDSSLITDAMLGALNEMYSRKLSKAVKRGMVYHAQKGEYQTPPPFGYKKMDGKMYIVSEEAAIVRKIFEMFIESPAWHSVAVKLNNYHVKKRSTAAWSSRDVKRMLNNSAYIGNVNYLGVEYKGKHEPILDMELWDKVQTIIENRPKRTFRPPSSYKHWLSGLLKCGKCGNAMNHVTTNKGNRSYRCCGYANGLCNFSNFINVVKLEPIIKTALEKLLENENLIDYENFIVIRKDEEQIEALQTSLKKVRLRLSRHKEAYSSGVDTLMEYKENKEKCLKEEESLLKQIEDLSNQEVTNEKIEKVKKSSRELIDLLFSDSYSNEQKSTAIKSLIEKIIFNKYTGEVLVYYYL